MHGLDSADSLLNLGIDNEDLGWGLEAAGLGQANVVVGNVWVFEVWRLALYAYLEKEKKVTLMYFQYMDM